MACGNAEVLRDDCIAEDFNPHSALLAEHVTSQEQINTKFAFSVVSYMLSSSKTCIEMAINTMIAPGGGIEVGVPGCSSPPWKLK